MTGIDLLAAAVLGPVVFLAATLALRARDVKRVRNRLAPHVSVEQAPGKQKLLQRGRTGLAGVFTATERAFGDLRAWRKLGTALERADAPLRAGELFYVMIGSGLALSLFLAAVGLPGALMLLTFPVGAVVPYVILNWKGGRRQKAFDDQLPDLLMTMAASVRVGHTFRQSMQAVVKEGLQPASKEFGRVLLETNLGRPLDRALTEMAQRLGSRNFDYVINVVTIQREVGGSLATLFDTVSETVRQRQQFTKRVKALTAMGRMSAYVLIAMPFLALAVLSAINTSYTAPLFTTSTGRLLIIIALTGMAIGSVIIKKIVSFRMA